MTDLLAFIIRYYPFIFDEMSARFVDSQVSGSDALLLLELGNLRVGFALHREQITLEFQSKFSASGEDWFSVDVMRHFCGEAVLDDEVLDGSEATFVRDRLRQIEGALSEERHLLTERVLQAYKEERANRLFGP